MAITPNVPQDWIKRIVTGDGGFQGGQDQLRQGAEADFGQSENYARQSYAQPVVAPRPPTILEHFINILGSAIDPGGFAKSYMPTVDEGIQKEAQRKQAGVQQKQQGLQLESQLAQQRGQRKLGEVATRQNQYNERAGMLQKDRQFNQEQDLKRDLNENTLQAAIDRAKIAADTRLEIEAKKNATKQLTNEIAAGGKATANAINLIKAGTPESIRQGYQLLRNVSKTSANMTDDDIREAMRYISPAQKYQIERAATERKLRDSKIADYVSKGNLRAAQVDALKTATSQMDDKLALAILDAQVGANLADSLINQRLDAKGVAAATQAQTAIKTGIEVAKDQAIAARDKLAELQKARRATTDSDEIALVNAQIADWQATINDLDTQVNEWTRKLGAPVIQQGTLGVYPLKVDRSALRGPIQKAGIKTAPSTGVPGAGNPEGKLRRDALEAIKLGAPSAKVKAEFRKRTGKDL